MTKLVQALAHGLGRLRWPLAALGLHALLAVLLWLVPPRRDLAGRVVSPALETETTFEVGVASTGEGAAVPAKTEDPAARPVGGAGHVARSTERTTQPATAEAPAPAGPIEPVNPSSPGADGTPSAGPIQITRRGPEDLGLGLGGPNPFVPTSAAAVEEAEARRAVRNAVRDPARERERELGLGPEGPVLTALGESTARSTAPVRGRAVFTVTANAAGEVVELEVGETEGSRAGWADAGQIALAALRGKKLRLPPNTTRAVMRIEVKSAWKLPSGQDPGTDVTLFHLPIAKGEGKDSAKMTILDPIPKIHVEYVEIGGPGGAKIPIPVVELNLFATDADPTNIGASARRVVHARSLETQLM